MPLIANIFLRLVNNLKNISTLILVVAVALIRSDGRVLMQRRREDTMHGGLWEFPGGKVKARETAEQALIREVREELALALDPAGIAPFAFVSDPALPPAPREPYVILLYTCRSWQGEPRCLAGEELGWFAPGDLTGLAMPPLDVPLAMALAGQRAAAI